MPPALIEAFGFAAALLTTISFLPQVVRIWRRKQADDISLPAFTAFTLGVACWLTYGLLLGKWPLIVANVPTLILAASVLLLTLRYRRRQGR